MWIYGLTAVKIMKSVFVDQFILNKSDHAISFSLLFIVLSTIPLLFQLRIII